MNMQGHLRRVWPMQMRPIERFNIVDHTVRDEMRGESEKEREREGKSLKQ